MNPKINPNNFETTFPCLTKANQGPFCRVATISDALSTAQLNKIGSSLLLVEWNKLGEVITRSNIHQN